MTETFCWRTAKYTQDHHHLRHVMKTTLKTKHHRILAHVEIDSRGVHRITDHHHRTLGYYDPRTNRTTDRHHRVIGYGYLLAKLIPADLAEEGGAGTIQPTKPKKPRTPQQMRRASERRSKISQDMGAEANRHADRMRSLRDKLAGT
jgi:hypothetical protein